MQKNFSLLPFALCLAAVAAAGQGVIAARTSAPSPSAVTPEHAADLENRLSDWAQLGHYRQANLELARPAAGSPRVVFLGDSITQNWGSKYGRFFPGKAYVNRGISGQTTPQMLVRFTPDVLALHPAVVVIFAGTNDVAENNGPEPLEAIEDNFRAMVTLARAAHVRVVLCSVLPAASFPWRTSIEPREKIRLLNDWLRKFAGNTGAVYVDFYSAMVDRDGGLRTEFGADLVHPNDAGYAVMEPLAAEGIARALRSGKR